MTKLKFWHFRVWHLNIRIFQAMHEFYSSPQLLFIILYYPYKTCGYIYFDWMVFVPFSLVAPRKLILNGLKGRSAFWGQGPRWAFLYLYVSLKSQQKSCTVPKCSEMLNFSSGKTLTCTFSVFSFSSSSSTHSKSQGETRYPHYQFCNEMKPVLFCNQMKSNNNHNRLQDARALGTLWFFRQYKLCTNCINCFLC